MTDHVLGDDSSLQTVQTMFRMLKLRDMETGMNTKAFQAAEAALLKAAGKTLQSAAAQTGDEELDDLTGIAKQSSHNLDAVIKRWGMQGVNYIGNLLQAGRGDLAAAITAMPTYAKSAIVVETNMRTFGLNDDAITAQENALAADLKSPIVVLSAKQIAKQQAVEARKAELTAGGAFKVQSVLVQKVNDAGKTVSKSKPVLNQALRNEQAVRDALAKAQTLFHKNMADTAAADTLAAAIDQLQKAIDARAKAQKTHTFNQQTLNDAQQKLDGAQKQAAARVDEQAKQDVETMRMKLAQARVKLMEMAGGQAEEQENMLLGQIQLGNVSNDGNTLAQMDENDIMESAGIQGEVMSGVGNALIPDEQTNDGTPDIGDSAYKAKMLELDKVTTPEERERIIREACLLPEEWAEKMRKEEALTIEDKAAGIKVISHGGKIVYDYSKVINNILSDAVPQFTSRDVDADHNQKLSLGEIVNNYDDFIWFMNQVNHRAPWDLKIDKSWETTIGNIRKPEYTDKDTENFLVNGSLITREDLGNIIYGYLGSSMGISPEMLYVMGGVANKINMATASPVEIMNALETALQDAENFGDNKKDHDKIEIGIQWYNDQILKGDHR